MAGFLRGGWWLGAGERRDGEVNLGGVGRGIGGSGMGDGEFVGELFGGVLGVGEAAVGGSSFGWLGWPYLRWRSLAKFSGSSCGLLGRRFIPRGRCGSRRCALTGFRTGWRKSRSSCQRSCAGSTAERTMLETRQRQIPAAQLGLLPLVDGQHRADEGVQGDAGALCGGVNDHRSALNQSVNAAHGLDDR